MEGDAAGSGGSRAVSLRSFVTDRLAAASREILAVVETALAAYEAEAAGFRREISRQRGQLELLETRLSVTAAGSGRNLESAEEEEHLDPTGPSRVLGRRDQNQDPINLRFSVLEDSTSRSLSETALKRRPQVSLRCPRGLQGPDLLERLRSAVPQLAGTSRTFEIFTLDKKRRLQPLSLEDATPEKLLKRSEAARSGGSLVCIQLKEQDKVKDEAENGSAALSSSLEAEGGSASSQQEHSMDAEDQCVAPPAAKSEGCVDEGGGGDTADEEEEESPAAASCCGVCGVALDSDVALMEHSRSHMEEAGSDGREAVSKVTDTDRGERRAEASSVCGESPEDEVKPHRCPTCGEEFHLAAQLEAHRSSHQSRTFLCGVCGKFLSSKRSLSRHKMTHSGERPHGCRVCGRGFKLPTTLRQHEKIHEHRERSYLCDVCCKMFLTGKQLAIHMRTHTNEKPHRCAECGKGFTTRGPLTIHMRVHTGETPYRCPYCGWAFKRKTHLDEHVAVHTGAKPYTCTICGKTCARKTYLTVHMRTHNGERPYKCGECGKAFTQSHCLKTHLKSHGAAP